MLVIPVVILQFQDTVAHFVEKAIHKLPIDNN